ncbi:3-deoxy-manno-octulosonate cytidylyltransferase [Patescibacteria group bacterium]|nr:3-deoxy-manno-octulosonate cytidylyltransferase [Patescibacteria group bacterium]
MDGKHNKVVGIIPARYASTRLPGKPLVEIAGKTMLQRTYEQAVKSHLLDEVVVATDDERILNHVVSFGGKALMTSREHQTGTDRVAETARHFSKAEIIVDVQGDEPLVHPSAIDAVVEAMLENPDILITNLIAQASEEDADDVSIVKAVYDKDGFALYFSRSRIPFPRQDPCSYYKVKDVYGFRPAFLKLLASLPQTTLEKAESVEQNRVLEHGYKLKLVLTPYDFQGVNTPEDLEKVRRIFTNASNGRS